jgi:hypothetical protein
MIFRSQCSRKQYCLTVLMAAMLLAAFGPRMEQDPAYHQFAGPRAWDVATNLPFVGLGLWGWRRSRGASARVLAAGVILTGLGSAYYHASPSDPALIWDRLPMTLTFLPLLALVLGVWVDRRWATRTLWPLSAFGVTSVAWWAVTGDLRLYGIAQFGPALVLVPAQVSDRRIRPLWRPGVAYVGAKLAEAYDAVIYTALGLSGHAIKHLLAALAAYWVLQWSYTCFATEPQNPGPHRAGIKTAH